MLRIAQNMLFSFSKYLDNNFRSLSVIEHTKTKELSLEEEIALNVNPKYIENKDEN